MSSEALKPINFPFGSARKRRSELAETQHETKQAPRFLHTQAGISDRLAYKYPDSFRHVPSIGWFCWNGKHWANDDRLMLDAAKTELEALHEQAETMMKQALSMELEAKRAGEMLPEKAKSLRREAQELLKLVKKESSYGGLKGVAGVASVIEAFRSEPDIFDSHPWLLNCANGTLNLKSGELREHRPSDHITKMIKVPYDSAATCPQWQRFMLEIMQDDPEMVAYLQRIIGLCLSGSTEVHAFFVLYGNGRNGKSTFMTTIQELLGNGPAGYACEIPAELLMLGRSGSGHGPTEGLARLRAARLATANESESNQRLAEATVKQLTGGDMVVTRLPYERRSFEFKPEFKLFLRTNHRPAVHGDDDGMWRRNKLIPFDAQFSDDKADKLLSEKLKPELPGILAWAVRGLHDYLADGLPEPAKVKEATQAYRDEQDSFGVFIRSELLPGLAPDEGITVGDVAAKYSAWSQLNDARKLTGSAIGKALTDGGWEERRGAKGIRRRYPPASLKNLCHPTATGQKSSSDAAYNPMEWLDR